MSDANTGVSLTYPAGGWPPGLEVITPALKIVDSVQKRAYSLAVFTVAVFSRACLSLHIRHTRQIQPRHHVTAR